MLKHAENVKKKTGSTLYILLDSHLTPYILLCSLIPHLTLCILICSLTPPLTLCILLCFLDSSRLAAFEYYYFLFAYYLIHCQPGQQWPSFGDAVYTRVFEAYLQHFMPFQGPVPFTSSPQRSPSQNTEAGHPATPQFGLQRGAVASPIVDRPSLLKVASDMSTPARQTSHIAGTETTETETETFLQVIIIYPY